MAFFTGSSNSIHKFGLADNAGPTTSIPKMTDLWYAKLYDINGQNQEVRHKNIKSVSEINIQITTQTVDQYGKRIHVPTRVDFPSVTITFYDTMDGEIFKMAREVYEYHFGNNRLNPQSKFDLVNDNNNYSGRIPSNSNLQHWNYFPKIELWHMKTASAFDRIVIANPTITSISFSDSNYSTSDLRTITMTMDPENIILRDNETDSTIPSWIKKNSHSGT